LCEKKGREDFAEIKHVLKGFMTVLAGGDPHD
jgi:hypothetical protein